MQNQNISVKYDNIYAENIKIENMMNFSNYRQTILQTSMLAIHAGSRQIRVQATIIIFIIIIIINV